MIRLIAQVISCLALLWTVIPAVIFYAGGMGLDAMKWNMLAATVVWFVTSPLWMGRAPDKGAAPTTPAS